MGRKASQHPSLRNQFAVKEFKRNSKGSLTEKAVCGSQTDREIPISA